MKRKLLALAAVALTVTCLASTASAIDITGYDSDMFASQSANDAFIRTVKNRMTIARLGDLSQYSRGMAVAPLVSESAYGQTSRYSSSRQLDCVYYNGFTVWGAGYGTWSRQKTKDGNDGYKFRTAGPAIGFDWSNGTFTAGVATTYSWGKIQGKDLANSRKTRTWGIVGYGQYNHQLFYINANLGYNHNRYRDNGRNSSFLNTTTGLFESAHNGGNYKSNAWNFATEFGYKFKFTNGIAITPNIGFRYFHDKRNGFSENGTFTTALNVDGRNYHVFELPIGVDVGYDIRTGSGTILRPHLNFTWVPELDRKRGKASYNNLYYGARSEESARRGRNGYNIGGGLQAKFTESISAHLDYNVELRDRKYEHTLNLGLGFTF
jgi:outer membrane autotransporter barrel domain